MVEKENAPISWKLRKRFWNKLATLKFKGNKPVKIPVPVDIKRMIRAVPLNEIYPSVDIPNILVADHIPVDEISRLKKLFVKFQIKMNAGYSAMQPGLPPIDQDPDAAIADAYTNWHRKRFRAPQRPPELEISDVSKLLGAMAVKGPFAGYLKKDGDVLQWDLRDLDKYQHRSDLHKLGVRVLFEVDNGTRSLCAYEIQSALGTSRRDDEMWSAAGKLALCALSTHTTLVRHFNWVHLACGSPIAIATRNQLPSKHPLRRLLWPHLFGTQFSNDMFVEVSLNSDGDLPNIFSFTDAGLLALFSETYEAYRISQINPPKDALHRGIQGGDFDTPTQDNLEELFAVIRDHADRYVRAYYSDDMEIASDKDVHNWLQELDRLIPNGFGVLLAVPLTLSSVADIAASFIYLGCVQHELLGTHLWNYQLWTNTIPVRIYKNGRREPLDVYQRLVNANFNLNVRRAKLMQNFSYLAVDDKGKSLFLQFLGELRALDADMGNRPVAHWRIHPHKLEANINA